MPAYLLPVVSAVAAGVLVRLLDYWRDRSREERGRDIDMARMRNHQSREEARWADEEQRWSLVAGNEGKLSERLVAVETELRLFRARFEESGGRHR